MTSSHTQRDDLEERAIGGGVGWFHRENILPVSRPFHRLCD